MLRIALSYETLKDDDIGWIAKKLRSEARAARRTHEPAILDLWASNAVYLGDGLAWVWRPGAQQPAERGAHGHRRARGDSEAARAEAVGRGRCDGLSAPAGRADPARAERAVGDGAGAGRAERLGDSGPVRGAGRVRGALRTSDGSQQLGVHWSSAIAPSVSVLSFAGREEPSLLGPTDEWEPQGMQRDELTFKIEHHWQPVINDFRFAVKSTVA
jgi:hypothetical protein